MAAEATEVLNAKVFAALDLDAGELSQLFTLLRRVRAATGDFASGSVP